MNSAPYVVVATPCYGGVVTAAYTSALLSLQEACRLRGVRFAYLLESGDALVTRVRANLMTQVLDAPGTTHLLFVDADIGFRPEQFFRLFDLDVDVAAGAYPIKSLDWEKLDRAVSRGAKPEPRLGLNYVGVLDDPSNRKERSGFARAKYVGNGFLLLKREALVRMCEAFPELRYKNLHVRDGGAEESPHRVALFDTMIDPETRAYLPEDFAFCQRWRHIGGEIWLDMQSVLSHTGQVMFDGDMAAP